MTAPTTATAPSGPRPAVLDLPPDRAAREVAVGAPCPVCGVTLVEASSRPESGALLGAAALLGVLGLALANVFGRVQGCRCATCELHVRRIPTQRHSVASAVLVLVMGLFLAVFGLALLHAHPNGSGLLVGVLGLVAGLLSPVYAWVQATRPWKVLAAKIARGRARLGEAPVERTIQIDPDALLRRARPGGTCPVCEKGKLEGPDANVLWTRGALGCPTCRIEVQASLTPLGTFVGITVAVGLVALGAYALWVARESAGNAVLFRSILGIVLALGGLYTGFLVQGSGDDAARRDLERARRSAERRRLGLPVRDEEEEPSIWFQENLEAVVVAFILALVIRHFVMEAFVIPTGSMAPTLLGDHFVIECKNCHYKFAVQKVEGRIGPHGEDVWARCPLCGVGAPENQYTFYDPDVHGGNKILVNKFIYKLEQPERYQVVVFKYPRNPTRNFIKRLVGLSEETLKIDGRGDVWVKPKNGDKFALARKPENVQEELWMPVFDARFPDPRGSAWRPEDVARWESRRAGDGSEVWAARTGSGPAWLDYGREIRDWYGYNKGWGGGAKPVGDVRVRTHAIPAAGAHSVSLAIQENDRTLVAELPVDGDQVASISAVTSKGRTQVAACRVRALHAGSGTDLAFAYADERLTLSIDGSAVLSWDDPNAPGWTETSSVRLGSDAAGATFEATKVDRDIFYVPAHGAHPEFDPTSGEVKVPADCYFMMGDNSPNSEDGRVWGFVHEPHLIGRAFMVFWPLDEVKLIR